MQPEKRTPTHPGEILRDDVLPAMGVSVNRAAQDLGVSRQHLHRILKGTHPVTADMALRLGKLCGNGAGFWIRLQTAHDLHARAAELKDDLDRIPTYEPAE